MHRGPETGVKEKVFKSIMSNRSLPAAILLTMPGIVLPSLRAQIPQSPSELRSVDVFLGADGGGNTTPGAQVPFGFVSLQPDTERPSTSGYRSNDRILGFSSTHVSGTGGASKYGNFRATPFTGPLDIPVAEAGSQEVAWPGYYAVTLGPPEQSIRAELTASRLVGFHRYTFPRTRNAHVVIQVSSVITNWAGTPQRPLSCSARSDARGLSGSCRFSGGWNPGEYQLYFAAQFDRQPIASGVAKGSRLSGSTQEVRTGREWEPAWAWASFDTTVNRTVQMKLAVSFLGTDKAQENLRAEETWDFEHARHEAERQWSEALARIHAEGGSAAQRALFASSLYRAQVMPHDLTGENVWWQSSEPHYEDYYTLWDTFRTQDPLLTVIQPERERDLVRSMVDTYQHTGWMPDARIAGNNGSTQGGSNGDVLIADALVKGVKGIDYETAFEALVKNAESDSPNPNSYGRDKMSIYKKLGYLPYEEERSGSRTMEYCYDDFAISEVAEALGKTDETQKYRQRALFWTNLWDKDTLSVHPRYADGRWTPNFDRGLTTKPWNAPFYEGSPWQYSTYVPHDVQGLINRTGGDVGFVAWLDQFFAEGKYDPGNEPDMLAPWLYIHAGRPDRTQAIVRQLLDKYYKPGRAGLPGNDDAGAMTSWYVWAALGLYPNAGQPYYYIGAPVFTRIRIDIGGGKTFTIEAPKSSTTNRYVQSARLNGHPLQRAWLNHAELLAGGSLELDLGPEPANWGAGQRPYSLESPQ
ncbi:MAG TPA: GH92 family glycosyl hydrolase [Acidobacteriaceae bacterium]